MKILLVEDDDRILQPVLEDLRQQYHVVDTAQDGAIAWEILQIQEYDLILLDLMLPQLDGISLCQRIRQHGISSMVLMLTARDTLSDRIQGLDAGADDYLVKPFEMEELSARMRALSRRMNELQQTLLKYGSISLNLDTRFVLCGEQVLNLTPKEFMILACFLRSPNRVLTKEILLNQLWEVDSDSSANTVKTHINNLRRKLREAGATAPFIQTVYGVGYRFAPLEIAS